MNLTNLSPPYAGPRPALRLNRPRTMIRRLEGLARWRMTFMRLASSSWTEDRVSQGDIYTRRGSFITKLTIQTLNECEKP